MAGMRFIVKVTGFKELRQKLKREELLGPPWRSAMEEIGSIGADAVRAAAPTRSGLTASKTGFRVQKGATPFWTVVATKAKRKGFPYPRITNFSPYANSRYHKGVNPNRGWFTNATNRARAALGAVLNRAADEIQRRWSS